MDSASEPSRRKLSENFFSEDTEPSQFHPWDRLTLEEQIIEPLFSPIFDLLACRQPPRM
mgnify:CR=1 FL=1